jgi:hypothetical protein
VTTATAENPVKLSDEAITGPSLTAGYVGNLYGPYFFQYQKRPQFTLQMAEAMLYDHQVWFALQIGNAPLMSAEVEVKGPSAEVNKFVKEQWERIWSTSASKLLKARYFGWCGYEVLYQLVRGRKEFAALKDFHPRDVRPIIKSGTGNILGIAVRGTRDGQDPKAAPNPTIVPGMRALWLAYDAQHGSRWGTAGDYRAYGPWWDKTTDGGAYDLRRLRMFKDAWIGDVLRYPNKVYTLPDGRKISGREIVQEIAENRASGGAVGLPSDRDDKGNYLFDYQPPQDIANSPFIRDCIVDMDDDIFDGCEVPKEVVEAASSGSGYSGRSIPMTAFLGMRDVQFGSILRQVDGQTLRPLVVANYGYRAADYDIRPIPLLETFGDQVGGQPEGGRIGSGGPGQLGGQQQGGYQPPLRVMSPEDSQFSVADELEEQQDKRERIVVKSTNVIGARLAELLSKKND